MIDYDDDLADERNEEPEPRELPEFLLEQPGPCCICGKPERTHGCFRCGKPVCINEQNYLRDSACGSWILDWWTVGAYDPDDGNEFWCQKCVEQALAAGARGETS